MRRFLIEDMKVDDEDWIVYPGVKVDAVAMLSLVTPLSDFKAAKDLVVRSEKE